jgi:hypothetical protein
MRYATPFLLLCAGCAGIIGDLDDGSDEPAYADHPRADLPPELHVAETGLRRLTAYEYDNTVRDLLGFAPGASAAALPEDAPDPEKDYPFDNDYESQAPSLAMVEGTESLAIELGERIAADESARSALLGCEPTGPGDAACVRSFVERFGRRVFRRPLATEEVDAFVALQAFGVEADDFWLGVETIVTALFLSPHFVYRVEIGEALPDEPGVFRLTPYEIATRLSYFLWATTPDDALLDLAASGGLASSEQIREVAARMLEDERGRAQVQRFHAAWLHYEALPVDGALGDAMLRETEALVDRAAFGDEGWTLLFTSPETFVDDALASHYGIPSPGSDAGWVRYDDGDRGGVLSHGAFLSAVGGAGEDTNPIERGKVLTSYLLCRPIPPPPPDVPPLPEPADEHDCRITRLREVHATGGCAGCHQHMDGIGYGLEQYDGLGRFRTSEFGRPTCELDGAGTYPETEQGPEDSFRGPGELGALMVERGEVQLCAATQLFRFAMGRSVRQSVAGLRAIHGEDLAFVEALGQRFTEGGSFEAMILDLVSSEVFTHRVER